MLKATIIPVLLIMFLAACARDEAPELNIAIAQGEGGTVEIAYEWRRPQREAAFNAVADDYRAARWTLPPDFGLKTEGDRDVIARLDGKRFTTLTLTAEPPANRLPKEYQPVVRYGEGGVLIYSGHFWPLKDGDARVDAVFDLAPAPGGQAVAFGENEPALEDWTSPMDHPAFVYMGPLQPVETDNVMALIDPEAPAWIVEEFNAIVPASFQKLAEMFGAAPETKPNLFLASSPGVEGQLSYAGDALPAQFQIMLEGGAWKEPNEQARNVFIQATAHEAVHLWQAAARPGDSEPPEWIHEGAADAMAAEIMVALGEWDAAAFERNEASARAECAAELAKGPLNGARERGDFRALYACGHVIALAVARADGETTADFWRAFIERAGPEGYSEAMFYDLVADRTGDKDFAEALEDFARTPLAEPGKEIDGLFAAAGALARAQGR